MPFPAASSVFRRQNWPGWKRVDGVYAQVRPHIVVVLFLLFDISSWSTTWSHQWWKRQSVSAVGQSGCQRPANNNNKRITRQSNRSSSYLFLESKLPFSYLVLPGSWQSKSNQWKTFINDGRLDADESASCFFFLILFPPCSLPSDPFDFPIGIVRFIDRPIGIPSLLRLLYYFSK